MLIISLFYVILLLNSTSTELNSLNTGYYPFPEMSRFLNSNSRIHHPWRSKTTFSVLEYLCSLSTRPNEIDQICSVFGEKYRQLIENIIERDCFVRRRH